MKKLILYGILIGIIIHLIIDYYKTGQLNNQLEKYPNSTIAQYIDYLIAQANYLAGDFDAAIFRFSRVLDKYNVDKYKAASYYMIAKSYEEKHLVSNAIYTYKELYKTYPKTYYGDLALRRVQFLESIR